MERAQTLDSSTKSKSSFPEFLLKATREELLQAFSEEWFNQIIPDAKKMVGCSQGEVMHLEGDVSVHTSYVFENFKKLAPMRLGREATFIELLACVVHDIKKPDTVKIISEKPLQISFPNHEQVAADHVGPIVAKNLLLSSEETKELDYLVRYHGEVNGFANLTEVRKKELSVSPFFKSLAQLQAADALSSIYSGGKHATVYWEEMSRYFILL